jgi:hypothetical protein
LALKLKPNTKE